MTWGRVGGVEGDLGARGCVQEGGYTSGRVLHAHVALTRASSSHANLVDVIQGRDTRTPEPSCYRHHEHVPLHGR